MISNTVMAGPALSIALGAQRLASLFTRSNAVTVVQRTRAQEAEALRAYAQQFVSTDPGFANDLFAAADRHEGVDA